MKMRVITRNDIVVKSVFRRVFREMRVTSSISGCDPTKTGYLTDMYTLILYLMYVSSSHMFMLVNFRYVKHFSCPRPILILSLEALLFCFDKHESDLNFNMHVL